MQTRGIFPLQLIGWIQQPPKIQEKVIAAMRILMQRGHEARRPLWAPLRDGIYELRVQHQNVHYRILCFFHKTKAIVAAHGCTKRGRVDNADIERAILRMKTFLRDPDSHTYFDPNRESK